MFSSSASALSLFTRETNEDFTAILEVSKLRDRAYSCLTNVSWAPMVMGAMKALRADEFDLTRCAGYKSMLSNRKTTQPMYPTSKRSVLSRKDNPIIRAFALGISAAIREVSEERFGGKRLKR